MKQRAVQRIFKTAEKRDAQSSAVSADEKRHDRVKRQEQKDMAGLFAYYRAQGLDAEEAIKKVAKDLRRDPETVKRHLLKAGQPEQQAPSKPGGRPQLRIQSLSVNLFRDGVAVARYATVEVAAVSGVEARDCWAWVDVLPSGPCLPLHWAGTAVTPDEASAPRITINPAKPARLDVAVALPPPGQTPDSFANAITSGEVTMFVQGRQGPPWNGEGCWLAQPVALYNPQPGLEAYRWPGEHRVRVRVGCEGGEGDTRDYLLKSPTSWEGLALSETKSGLQVLEAPP